MPETLPPTVSAETTSTSTAPRGHAPVLPRGTAVGRYLVLEHIGEGGMGIVYKAYDPDLDRSVALKLVRTELRNPDERQRLRARLLREAQALAKLAHPNVVAVHDVGTYEDGVFVAMELIDGMTLTGVLVEALPPARIIDLFVAAGRGLAAAHDVSIIHRDFKPDNVLVGGDGRVRVVDFGLARAIDAELADAPPVDAGLARATDAELAGAPPEVVGGVDVGLDGGAVDRPMTESRGVLGTPAYMAPEQRAGLEIDARADQYSFCVALHEALFRVRPPPEPGAVPARAASGARLPRRLRAALERGLAIEPGARHPSMRALLAELVLPVHRRWLAGGAVVTALGIAAVVVAATRPAAHAARCEVGEARLAGVWDAPRRAAVRDALLRHGDAGAPIAVERALDRYTAAWLAMHTASCRATHVIGDQSAELLDLRTQCLDRRLGEVRHLTELLVTADRDAARQAVTAVHELAPLDDCANAVALRDPVPPRDPALAKALRDQLALARAQLHLGRYDQVSRELHGLAAAAHGAGDRWLEASSLQLLAKASRQLGHTARAEDELYRAVVVAETGRASDVVVDAWMTLAWIAAEDRDRYADAFRLASVAAAVLERLGGNPRLEATLEDHLGVIHLDRNALADARRHLERGLALREQLYGAADSEYAGSLQHVAMLEEAAGDMAKALPLYHRAREIALAELGPRHPTVLAMVGAEGAALFKSRRYAEAVAVLAPGLALAEQVAGPRSDLTASFLTNTGLAQWNLQRYSEARAAFERAFAIHVARTGPDGLGAGTVHVNLALLLLDTGDLVAARSHAERAAAIFTQILGAGHPDVAMALEALASAELRTQRPAQAVAALERAVAIRAAAPNMPPNDLAATRFDLAKAIVAASGSPARARKLAEDARAALERMPDPEGVAEVSAWLQQLASR